jgi:hypothetical protein
MAIVAAQFAALIALVVLLSSFTPGQSAQSNPVISSVYWGTPGHGLLLQSDHLAKVKLNESAVTADFTVATSTQPSAVTGSRLCLAPNSTSGVSTTYDSIPFSFDPSKGAYSMVLAPTVQQTGWVCTYTLKVTDSLSQTSTWLGYVELSP